MMVLVLLLVVMLGLVLVLVLMVVMMLVLVVLRQVLLLVLMLGLLLMVLVFVVAVYLHADAGAVHTCSRFGSRVSVGLVFFWCRHQPCNWTCPSPDLDLDPYLPQLCNPLPDLDPFRPQLCNPDPDLDPYRPQLWKILQSQLALKSFCLLFIVMLAIPPEHSLSEKV